MKMKPWERELWFNTQEFAARVLPDLNVFARDIVVLKIYDQMHRTLRLYHEHDPPRSLRSVKQRLG